MPTLSEDELESRYDRVFRILNVTVPDKKPTQTYVQFLAGKPDSSMTLFREAALDMIKANSASGRLDDLAGYSARALATTLDNYLNNRIKGSAGINSSR